jgi:hypothetical protein
MSTRASGLPATARPGSAARVGHVHCSNSPSSASGRKRVRVEGDVGEQAFRGPGGRPTRSLQIVALNVAPDQKCCARMDDLSITF